MEETTPDWHYADSLRQQHGPLIAEELRARFERGELERASLVWRTGMPAWQPLETCAGELGIVLPSTAAALPASGPAVPSEGVVVYAGFWRRAAASIIDGFVTSILSYALLIPPLLAFGVSRGMLTGRTEAVSAGTSLLFEALFYGISLLLPAIYFGWLQASAWQASLGKLAVGIKVVRANGERIGFWRGFLRCVAYLLLVLLTCGVGIVVTALMAGLTRRKQAPHDFFCDTLVVDRWAYTGQPQLQKSGLGTVTIVVLALYGLLMLVAVIAVVAILMLAPGHT
ncbi:MAG: RDD family protein [Pseudomonas sp.]